MSDLRFVALGLPTEYPICLLMTGLLAFECIIIGFLVPGGARARVFKDHPQIMEKVMALHKKEMGVTDDKQALKEVKSGYPDHGNGRFCQPDTISYAQWVDFNMAQRGHKNLLEQLTTICTLSLVCGLELPIVASIATGLYGLVRLLYFLLKNRVLGFILGNVCLFTLMGGALYSASKLI